MYPDCGRQSGMNRCNVHEVRALATRKDLVVVVVVVAACIIRARRWDGEQIRWTLTLTALHNVLIFMTYFRSLCFTSVWSVITADKLTAAKREVTTVVSDQRSRFTAPSIDDYSTPETAATRKLATQIINSRIHTFQYFNKHRIKTPNNDAKVR